MYLFNSTKQKGIHSIHSKKQHPFLYIHSFFLPIFIQSVPVTERI